MRSLEEANKELSELQLQIRRLLLNHYDLNEGISDKLTVMSTISVLHEQVTKIKREIRLNYPDTD